MGTVRNFTPEVIGILAKNIDDNAGGFVDFFQDLMLGCEVLQDADLLRDIITRSNNYLRVFMEIEDKTHADVIKLLDSVQEIEDRYCAKIRAATERMRAIRVQLQAFRDIMNTTVRNDTLTTLYGAGVSLDDIVNDPEKLAQARFDAEQKGLDFPLSAAQLAASEAAYQQLLLVHSLADTFQDARAKGATQLSQLETYADISQLLVDVENYNRRNPNGKIEMPTLTPIQIRVVEEYRQEIAAIGDPLFNAEGSRVTSLYGYRDFNGFRWHRGIDIAAAKGSPIVSMWNGTVAEKGYNSDYGHYVIVETVIDGVSYEMVFMHMNEATPFYEGDTVVPGINLGPVGGTPNYAVHLHFELRLAGGDTWGFDNSQSPRKSLHVNPSIALNDYYDQPTILNYGDPGDVEDYKRDHPDEAIAAHSEPTTKAIVESINTKRNAERWPQDEE